MNPFHIPTYLAGSAHTQYWHPLIWKPDVELQWEMHRRELRAGLAALPSSSFARTVLDEDDLFYATFPGARRAAIDLWAAENLVQRSYIVAPAPQANHFSTFVSPTAAMPHTHHAPPSVNHPSHDFTHSNHLEAHASSLELNFTYDAVHLQPNRVPPFEDHRASVDQGQGSTVTSDVYCVGEQSSISKPSPPPLPEIVRITPQFLVPSQRRGGVQLPPTMPQPLKLDNLSSPSFSNTAETPPCSPFSTHSSLSSPAVPSLVSLSVVPLQFTGDWEADAMAAEKLLSASEPSHPKLGVVPSATRQDTPRINPHAPRLSLAHCKRRNTRSSSHPYASSTSRSPSASRTSPSRTRVPIRVSGNKDGKPAMACLFCRGRKIACGPPLPGSNSSTCNQCERRHLKCKYPAVNRRGMRRKKEEGDAVDAGKKDKGGDGGEAKKKDNRDHVVDLKKDDRDEAVDTNPASERMPPISGARACPVKAEYSEPEDVGISDAEDSSSEWDGRD